MDIFDGDKLNIPVFEGEPPEEAILPAHKTRRAARLKTAFTAIAVLLCFSVAIYGASSFVEPKIHAYSLLVNGRSVGVFTTSEEAEGIVNAYAAELGEYYALPMSFAEKIAIKQVTVRGAACTTAAEATDSVRLALTPVTEACGIYINDGLCITVDTQGDAETLLEAIKRHYAEGREGVASVSFAEKIECRLISVNPAQVTPTDEAYEYLLNHRYDAPQYTTEKPGENMYVLAENFNISVDELLAVNPGLDPDMLPEGTVICLGYETAPLTVKLERIETAERVIPYATQKIDDPNEYRGLERVVQEGFDGLEAVAYIVTEENGVEVAKSVISSTVLIPVSDYIVERGTKAVVASRFFSRTLNYEKKEIDIEFIRPLSSGIITDSFGKYRARGRHTGLDIAIGRGTEVKAMADGVVIFSEWDGSYGNMIKIAHGDDVETWYAHLSRRDVKLGDVVKQGDLIGLSGNTGISSGPHLHVEVRIDTVAYNPLFYLPEE